MSALRSTTALQNAQGLLRRFEAQRDCRKNTPRSKTQPLLAFALLALLAILLVPVTSCASKHIVVYAAQDQVYSEPILKRFTRETGIKVRALYDSEAVKTVGLANRLLAERSRPQCDIFWGNEEMRTRQLAERKVFRETNGWVAFGYRSRQVVINTNLLAPGLAPRTLTELTNRLWYRKVALANPLFGTTATHFLALRQYWGETNWLAWCRHLQANAPFLAEGNSGVVNLVGRGEVPVGITDSDDIAAGQKNRFPIIGFSLGVETLLIPNTVGIIRDAPNPEDAHKLFVYLQQASIAEELVAQNALEGVSSGTSIGLKPNWVTLLRDLDSATAQVKQVFLR